MKALLCTAIAAGMVSLAPVVSAQEAMSVEPVDYGRTADSGWTYQLQLYIWGTEVGGTALDTDFSIDFDVLVENLNFALMGGLKAFNGNWMSYGELAYADVGTEQGATLNPEPGTSVDVNLEQDVQTTIVSFGAGYRLVNTPDYTMYGTLGARYFRLESQIELAVDEDVRNIDTTNDYWDAVIGLEGEARFDENWFLPWRLDIGAGGSDLTWQAAAGIGYRFGRNDILFGYRHMEWDLPDDDKITNYYQSGPILLWNYRF